MKKFKVFFVASLTSMHVVHGEPITLESKECRIGHSARLLLKNVESRDDLKRVTDWLKATFSIDLSERVRQTPVMNFSRMRFIVLKNKDTPLLAYDGLQYEGKPGIRFITSTSAAGEIMEILRNPNFHDVTKLPEDKFPYLWDKPEVLANLQMHGRLYKNGFQLRFENKMMFW